ncbi:hypothetical protein ACFYYY_05225 [Streptomyces sp. NPDC001834]|uniref:hypothetical protein n=1 Tax=Streptomyces sp. NPDC001834 TaxID=3364616 RepID=UPI003693946C
MLFALIVTGGVVGCEKGEGFPAPKEEQIVGFWSNPKGDWIRFKKGGVGLISPGAQLQLSELMEESQTKDGCEFSWKVDVMPAGGGKWVSVTFAKGQCGFQVPGEFGLHYYYERSGDLSLSSKVEFPKRDETYSRSSANP